MKLKTRIIKYKKALIVLAAVLLLVFSALVYLSIRWKPIITQQIKESVLNSTDSLYTVDFADINVNLFTGSADLQKIVFKPDSAVFERLKGRLRAPRHLFQIEVDGLFLNNVYPWKIYFGRKLQMNSIVIEKPRIRVSFEPLRQIDSLENDKRTAYQRISKYLKSAKIQSIEFKEVDFQYIDKSYKTPKVDKVNNLEIKISDILIDSLSHLDKSRFYYTKDIAVSIVDHSYKTKDGLYTIKFKSFSASSKGRYAKIRDFRIVPHYPDLEFSRKFKVRKDRFSMIFPEIALEEIDFRKLNMQRKLAAQRLVISNGEISSFINKELPFPKIDKGRNFPHVALKRLELNTCIDTVLIRNTNIRYTEYNPETSKKGTIFFNSLKGYVLNVTNDSAALAKNSRSKARLSALFMGRGALSVNFNFNLVDRNASFSYAGEMGTFNMRVLNPLTRPLALVQIRSGEISKVTFDVKANLHGAEGSLKILYKDLKVKILKMNEEKNKIQTKGLVSLFANLLVIENENPTGDKPPRIGTISYSRPPTASFFSLMWRSLFTGLKETVGLSKSKEENLQKRVEKLDDVTKKLSDRNEDRKKKKEK